MSAKPDAEPPASPPITPPGPGERAFAWLVTGPLGRVAAFFADVGTYWWRRARGRVAGRGER